MFVSISSRGVSKGILKVIALQVDPYDYDTSLFILKLVKELSHEETAPAVDKVKMQFVCVVKLWSSNGLPN